MFERFTDRARHAVVFAQDEARMLDHDYIGTEHLLLGLLREPDSVAAKALASMGVSLDLVRTKVMELVGPGERPAVGHIPFTKNAKKVLELSLREALRLEHDYIGTEHVLLGLLREEKSVAAEVLVNAGVDLRRAREAVVELLSTYSGDGSEYDAPAQPLLPARERRAEDCVLCGVQLASRDRSVRGLDGGVCERCVARAAALLDEQRAPALELHPSRFDAVMAVERAFAALFMNAPENAQLKVERVEVRDRSAEVRFTVVIEGLRFEFDGIATLVGEEWLIAPETIADVTRAFEDPK